MCNASNDKWQTISDGWNGTTKSRVKSKGNQ